jgi:hypothetical protein
LLTFNVLSKMEIKTDRDNFEGFLKESADSFLMVPSRKVWYGIYNNMHPDRKWPSMAVCLLILSAVMYIGVSNNNSLSIAARKAGARDISGIAKNNAAEDNTAAKPDLAGLSAHPTTGTSSPASDAENNFIGTAIDNAGQTGSENIIPDISDNNGVATINRAPENNAANSAPNSINSNKTRPGADANGAVSPGNDPAGKNMINRSDMMSTAVHIPGMDNDNNDIAIAAAKKDEQDKVKKAALKLSAENNKSWMEDYAFRNKPKTNKFHSRSTITYFVTPSLGYRTFSAKHDAAGTADMNITDHLKDARALGMEAGTVLQYRVADNLRLKGGLQVNYTNYTSAVTDIGHSLVTSLSLVSQPAVSDYSRYEIKPGAATLNRSTVQVSVPIGADLKLAGRNKIKWYVGGTVQPSYLLGGSAYVISSDNKFYITEKSLLRRANLNVAAETFVSFRPSPGITLSVGPQVRYQLMSTYKSNYNYSEKLYNLGIKIGLTTAF